MRTTTGQDQGETDLSDPEAFGRWYQEHWNRAVAYARWATGDASLAEDIAADALVRSWDRWRIMGTPERPWAYVTTAIRNLAATHFRRAARDRERLTRLDRGATSSHEAAVVDRDLVRRLLPLLPTNERTAMVLHYLHDVSSTELAQRLAIPPVTVRSHLHRARRRLAALDAA